VRDIGRLHRLCDYGDQLIFQRVEGGLFEEIYGGDLGRAFGQREGPGPEVPPLFLAKPYR
jgi:hypothetical protein